MSGSIPSSSFFLIQPPHALSQFVDQYFSGSPVDICSSFEKALMCLPISTYQVVICPQGIASLDQYSLLRLSGLHNPCAPFIVTTGHGEFAFVQQAIDHGALGFLQESDSTADVLRTVQALVSLYRLRFSCDRREKWVADSRSQLQQHGITLNKTVQDNRVVCRQTLDAIAGSNQALRGHASNLVADAKERMRQMTMSV
jgi:DNA-binding NtrC family response regulator